MSRRSFTDDQVECAVRNKALRSIAAVLRDIGGAAGSGGSYDVVRRIVKDRELDTSHWLGNRIGLLKAGVTRPVLPLLRFYGPGEKLPHAHDVKLRLIRDGLKKRECEQCRGTTWLGGLIPIELHHVDGNKRNYQLGNLQILCPNCHALTPNYTGRNVKRQRGRASGGIEDAHGLNPCGNCCEGASPSSPTIFKSCEHATSLPKS